MEDVTPTYEDLSGEAPITKSEETPVETPVEVRKRLSVANEKALAKIQACELALAAAKKEAGEIAKQFQKLIDVKVPLHELNRQQREITRGEFENRQKARELVAELTVGQRPGTPTRPPLFDTGAAKKGE